MSVEVSVAARIGHVAARVRELGSGRVVVNEMAKEIRRAVPPVRKAVKRSAVQVLPSGGGLGRWVARASVRAAVKRAPRTASVALVAGRNSQEKRTDVRRIDAGSLRAPFYGNRAHWHLQRVQPGWFTTPVREHADDFRDAVVTAVENAERKVGLR